MDILGTMGACIPLKMPGSIMSFLVRKCLVIHTLLPSILWQGAVCVSFVLHRLDSCFLKWIVPEGTGQEGTALEGFNLWSKHVLVLFVLMDFPCFFPRAVRFLCHSVLLLCTSRSYMYRWTCTTVFLISYRKFSHFLSKASTFSPVIRISSVFLLSFYSGVKQWTRQYWFLLLPFPLQSA